MSNEPSPDGSSASTPPVEPDPAALETAAKGCRNCGAVLTGPFCANCGQSADTRIPTVWKLFGEFVDGLYNLDSRVWRTLTQLAFRPGKLTMEYFAGRRARYVAPFRLYLVVSLVFFVLDSFLENGQSAVGLARTGAIVETASDNAPAPEEEPSEIAAVGRPEADASQCRFVDDLLAPGSFLRQRTATACERVFADNGRALIEAFSDQLPLMMFLLIPLMAAFFKPLYLFTGRGYVEHLLFLFHVHAFYFLAATVSLLASGLLVWPTLSTAAGLGLGALWIYATYYAYRALRNVYGQGRLLTSLKFIVLLFAYLVVLSLTVALTFLFAAFSL